MPRLAILITDGMFDSSLAITVDILRTARQLAPDSRIDVPVFLTLDDTPGTGAGLHIPATRPATLAEPADYLIIPGLGLSDPDDLVQFLASNRGKAIVNLIQAWHKAGTIVTASCSATFLLAEAGILDNGIATTGWWLADIFRARYPGIDLQPERMLASGPGYLCAGAAMAQADLTLALCNQLYGQKITEKVARFLLIDQRHFQAQYMLSSLITHRHPDVAKAEQWIKANLHTDINIPAIATTLGLGTRTLSRRIKAATGFAPAAWIQHLRLERALHLLRTSRETIDSIALQVGYQNATSLRRIMLKHYGKSPSAFRQP